MNLISRLVLYLLGTLRLRLSGDYCERLLNVLASHNISFWKPARKGGNLYITVLRRDLKKIRLLRRNTGVKVKIVKKSGFPLVFNKYKHRYGLIAGFILFMALLNFLSGRMWMIEVNGNTDVPTEEIDAFFESCGIVRGVSMNSVDSDILKQQLILDFDNIAWASVNKQGSVIEVNVTEFTDQNRNEPPCNIVSQYDAVIKKVNVSKGSVNVKIGDTVSKNKILVSGIVNYGAGNSFVHSRGEIIAEIHLKKTVGINIVQENSLPTGKILNRRVIDIMGLKLPLYLGGVHGDFEVNETEKYMNIFGGNIPIIIHKAEYVFVNKTYSEITEKDASTLANQKLTESLKNMGATNINFSVTSVQKSDMEYTFDYEVVCLLDIGTEAPIEME